MMQTVIDSKTDNRSGFGWETKTTLKLIETDPNNFGINYDVDYKTGGLFGSWKHISGGPVKNLGNGSWVVNDSPKVTVIVSNYSVDSGQQLISMHVKIDVDVPVVGTVTIYDQTLGGRYGIDNLKELVAHISNAGQK